MKRLALGLMALGSVTLNQAFATDAPRGTLIELHSCELYAGGCVVSSEATLGGRYLLRAWEFAGGKFNGTDLACLRVAVLQAGSDNLAADKTAAEQTVVYLAEGASQKQKDALIGWLKSADGGLSGNDFKVRTAPLQFTKNGPNYTFSAGDFVSIKVAPLGSCVFGSCGEELWYKPRSVTTVFTVAINSASSVSEPALKLKWNDAGKRSVFVGRFGDTELTRNAYVTMDDFCGRAVTF